MPAPRKLRDEAGLAGYCAALVDVMAPWIEREALALRQCLERGVITGAFGTDARACEVELQRRAPREVPLLAEIVPTGGPTGFEPASLAIDLVTPPGVR